MNQYIQNKQEEFIRAVEFFKKEISHIRTGRANPAILEGIEVEAYGTKTPLNGLGNISVSDAKSMTVAPWDKGVLKNIEKALVDANLGVGIVNEGGQIRINVPQMTEENRKELVKKLHEKMEKTRITVRQVREEIKNNIEEAEKAKEISEDDKFRFVKELDEKITQVNSELKEISDKKETDIMTV